MSDLAHVAPPAPRPPDAVDPDVVLHGELVDPPAAPDARRLDLWWRRGHPCQANP
ncbi:hypothetical protein AB0C47_13180 [Micromonospora taraxaci]|uniref:hypothetical protein n=1 Tax=Micromonospora taraxaci TaxID=1316803 RepID=UPI003402B246